ncbi:MAG TPA: hypothetical protein VNS09_19270 [Solirubrobacter sp.]|nr:hypothetical protein [Solirubrobacter sp.]
MLAVVAGCGGEEQRRSEPHRARTSAIHTRNLASPSGYRIIGTPLVQFGYVSETLMFVVVRLDRELPKTRSGKRIAAKMRVDDRGVRSLYAFGRPAEHCYRALILGTKGSPTLQDPRDGQPVSVELRITDARRQLMAPARLQSGLSVAEWRRQERALGCTPPRLVNATYSIDEPTPAPTP